MTLRATPLRDPKQWPPFIRATFLGDVCLLQRFHVAAPCKLSIAVADTYLALRDHTQPDFVFYGLTLAGKPVGMIGVEPNSNYLVTFGLTLALRTKAGALELCRMIRTLTNGSRPIICGLYARNRPAARFLRRMGFVQGATPIYSSLSPHPGYVYTLYPN